MHTDLEATPAPLHLLRVSHDTPSLTFNKPTLLQKENQLGLSAPSIPLTPVLLYPKHSRTLPRRRVSLSKPSLARRGSGWAGDDDWDEDEGWDDEDGEDLEGGRAAPPAGANNADQVRPLLSAAAPPSSKPPPPQQLSRVAELPAYGGKIASGGAALVAADSLPRPGSTAKALGVAMAPPEPSVEDMFSSMGMGVDKKDVKAAKRISVKTQQRTRKMQTTASTEISYNSDRFKLDDDEVSAGRVCAAVALRHVGLVVCVCVCVCVVCVCAPVLSQCMICRLIAHALLFSTSHTYYSFFLSPLSRSLFPFLQWLIRTWTTWIWGTGVGGGMKS